MAAGRTPARYRDVLAVLKTLARNPDVSSDGLRAVLAGNIGEGYTQADVQRTREVAAEQGWDLQALEARGFELDAEGLVSFDNEQAYQGEIRRLHGILRASRDEIKALHRAAEIGRDKAKSRGEARRLQLAAAGVATVDEAFERLELFRSHIERHGECHADSCGDDSTLQGETRIEFIRAHADICTCGAETAYALAVRKEQTV